jgi:hypothetical protein
MLLPGTPFAGLWRLTSRVLAYAEAPFLLMSIAISFVVSPGAKLRVSVCRKA